MKAYSGREAAKGLDMTDRLTAVESMLLDAGPAEEVVGGDGAPPSLESPLAVAVGPAPPSTPAETCPGDPTPAAPWFPWACDVPDTPPPVPVPVAAPEVGVDALATSAVARIMVTGRAMGGGGGGGSMLLV